MSTVNPANGANNGAGTNGADANQGNQDLQAAFNTALQAAQKTLIISTIGNANLNALRARPN